MQAVLSKVDAALAAHFAELRQSAEQDAEAAKKKLAVRKRPTWTAVAKNWGKTPPSV